MSTELNKKKRKSSGGVTRRGELADLFQMAYLNFSKCEPIIHEVEDAIKRNSILTKDTKKLLLDDIKNIFSHFNIVVDEIGKKGRVR